MAAEFDRYESTYDDVIERAIGFGGREHDFYVRAKVDLLLGLIRRHVGDPAELRALDVGCGTGITDRHLGTLGELHGIDVSPALVERAQATNPEVRYHVGDAAALPFDSGAFDVVFAVGVVHHIPPGERGRCAVELERVLRRGGLAVVFEHNPLNPLTRLAVHRCEFDEDAVLLNRRETARLLRDARLEVVDERYILVTPWANRPARGLERALGGVPVGAQYYVAALATAEGNAVRGAARSAG